MHSLFCSKPEGILAARSRTRVPFQFNPSTAGMFEFCVYAKVFAVDSNGNPVMLPNAESTLLRLSLQEQQTNLENMAFRFNNNHDNSINNNSSSSVSSSVANALPLVAHVSGRAAFPTLCVEDIRVDPVNECLISDVETLWKQVSL